MISELYIFPTDDVVRPAGFGLSLVMSVAGEVMVVAEASETADPPATRKGVRPATVCRPCPSRRPKANLQAAVSARRRLATAVVVVKAVRQACRVAARCNSNRPHETHYDRQAVSTLPCPPYSHSTSQNHCQYLAESTVESDEVDR